MRRWKSHDPADPETMQQLMQLRRDVCSCNDETEYDTPSRNVKIAVAGATGIKELAMDRRFYKRRHRTSSSECYRIIKKSETRRF